jgi:hypothetical protein
VHEGIWLLSKILALTLAFKLTIILSFINSPAFFRSPLFIIAKRSPLSKSYLSDVEINTTVKLLKYPEQVKAMPFDLPETVSASWSLKQGWDCRVRDRMVFGLANACVISALKL